ncbi:MAG: 50S ribosomal protein L2 [Candidatus Aenigmarchaeota archaeon]|nr:50S ribosomal protein L2 [Candidatus Aenigmarchaeota archaeon]
MGKNLKQQRRGKGNTRYLAPSHRYIGKIRYLELGEREGVVIDIVHSTGKHTPVAVAEFNGKHELMIPASGTAVGQKIRYGTELTNGNVVPINSVPEGTRIFNIELRPGDGGKMCRAPGCFATMSVRGDNQCVIELPSRRQVSINANCRATIGIPAGYGRQEKPFMKAGNKYFAMKAKGTLYPIVRGAAQNAVDHPFGGKTSPGKEKTVSRSAPPGRKVGMIAAKRTGKRRGR